MGIVPWSSSNAACCSEIAARSMADQWSRSRSSPGGELSRGTLLGMKLNASKWKEREMKLKQAVQTGHWKQWQRKAAWSQPVLCILCESSRQQCLRGAVWGGGVRAAWRGSGGTNLSDKGWQANPCSEVLCHPRETVMFIETKLLQHLGYKDRVTLLFTSVWCQVPRVLFLESVVGWWFLLFAL